MSSEPNRQTVTLAFHKLTHSYTFGGTNYSPKRFRQLLQKLRAGGLLLNEENGGEVVVSFDDGYAHLAESLPPLIDEFCIRPLVFVPTGWIGRTNGWDYSTLLKAERHLSAPEIRSLALRGVRFGSHGHSHQAFTSLDDASLRDELSRSKSILEDILGGPVDAVSYPFGKTDCRVMDAASAAGYTHGYSMSPPSDEDSVLMIGRIPVYFFDTPSIVLQKITDTGLSRLWHGLGKTATALSSGTMLLHRLKLLRTAN